MTYELPPDDDLIPATEVRTQFGGISKMTLWRWVHDPDLGFPQPVQIRGRNYFYRRETRAVKDRIAASRGVA